nr:hypothetical protein [Thermococcus sp.]
MGEERTFMNYLAFTVPHVTVFAGAVFGILLLIGIDLRLSLGIFATLYGVMLTIIGLIVRPHFSSLLVYRLYMIFSVLIGILGIALLLPAVRGSL